MAKVPGLLRELFQFERADLDFGIYRIMNHKRAVIEPFITGDLPKAIAGELARGALAQQSQAMQALEAARKKVLETLGDDALDANGNLAEAYRNTKAGKEYLAAREMAAGARSREALEAAVYNHLYTFFSRYWQEGDFISRRRYSKKERYAIPYNGEEVYLYWANHDQYYIKTGEYFTDYTYKAPNGVTVHFKLRQADVEQNNVKGEKRFFLPSLDEITWDEAARQVVIPFEYRPLTAQEAITYGQKNQQEAIAYSQKNQQEAIIAQAVAEIPKRVKAPEAIAALTAERRYPGNADVSSALEYHLRQYTRRNTSDFFIHKDLKGFLSRELDFYLKNEVLNLEEMEAAGERLSEGWFQLMRLIKRIGTRIIEFLAQIEEFQKMLWEKRKFVAETFYCITIGNIPERFYPEIAACEAQWDEWKTLFDLEVPQAAKKRAELLQAHPTLILDTRHFPADFTDRLLASFDNLDEMTDGLLVHAENWQALNLLQEKYRERVKCIYIDPPYNTGSDGFVFKDSYQHSSWLSMLSQLLTLSSGYLASDACLFSSIDDVEFTGLRYILQQLFREDSLVSELVWKKRGGGDMTAGRGSRLSVDHDYVVAALKRSGSGFSGLPLDEADYSNPDNDPDGPWTTGDLTCNKTAEERPNLFYDLVDPATGNVFKCNPKRVWAYEPEKMKQFIERTVDGRWLPKVLFPSDPNKRPKLKVFLKDRLRAARLFSSWMGNVPLNATATRLLDNILGQRVLIYPKPLELIEILARQVLDYQADVILDFFAGSGTTGHAVINLNREDGGRRKFILVEMADYFDTVLLPRIKKVTFAPEWKDGKPRRMATPEEAERSPRIVKVIRLESYEDALNNLTFDEESGQKALELFKDDYLLSYMLRWETRASETLLNVEKLQSPFSYKLHIHRDGETRERPVDLPETFNYLLGLDVQRRKVYINAGGTPAIPGERYAGSAGVSLAQCPGNAGVSPAQYLVYRGRLRNGRTVVVLWRDITGWGVKDYEREAAFVAQQKLTAGADEIYVNGDSRIPGARSLDPIFKERMFATMEA